MMQLLQRNIHYTGVEYHSCTHKIKIGDLIILDADEGAAIMTHSLKSILKIAKYNMFI